MPAQIAVSHAQLEVLAEQGHDVVITEAVPDPAAATLDCWIIDEESAQTDTHRSLVITADGDIIGDQRLEDDK